MNTSSRRNQWQPALVCALLIVATLAVYWPVRHFDFINYDDPHYVTENSRVRSGLSSAGIVWAFQTGHAANWHPLTWLSHMLDVQVFGVQPGPHHLVNLGFHTANALLLFLLFHRMTGALWRSAFVAALFALHPLHVESVAWVSERKDVLSTLFGLLAIWAYTLYAEKSRVQGPKSKVAGAAATHHAPRTTRRAPRFTFHVSPFYLLSLLLFALSLMSKPMLVTLPFLLLLLDFWPLGRLSLAPHHHSNTPLLRPSAVPLLLEKLPFLALSAASSAVTLLVQHKGGAVSSLDYLPIASRVNNALVAYCAYLGKTFWPDRLAVFYPYNSAWPASTLVLAALLLGAVSAAALLWRRRCPPFPVGWFWFLGTLVPIIGLVQVGGQAMADRYTYLPLVGVFLLVAWLPPDLLRNWRYHPFVLRTAGVVAVLLCLVLTRIHVGCWKDGETLFRHTIAMTTDNYVAHHQLGVALADQGKSDEARAQFAAALKIKPNYSPALSDLAKLLYGEGQFAAAAALLQQVLASNPNDALAHTDLALALAHQGKTEEALPYYHKAIRLKPQSPDALNNLAWFLATQPSAELRNGAEAVSLAERACGLTEGTNIWMVSTLAAAYAEAGRFAEAVATQHKVCHLAAAQGQTDQVEAFQHRLDLYRSHQPYHEP